MKQIYLINAINKELSKIVEYYESVTTKHIMVIGSAALSLRGIPIIPEDIDIVVPVSLDANPPKIEINIASKT